ncbi:MAG: hypothetical protein ACTSWZ_00765 [Candidatus Heimdallarchaeaceae archaeon]
MRLPNEFFTWICYDKENFGFVNVENFLDLCGLRNLTSYAILDKIIKKEVDEMVKLVPKKVVEIPEGKHTFELTKVELRTEPFEYLDFYFKLTDVEGNPEVKYGVPYNFSVGKDGKPRSKLAKLLEKLGVDVTKEIDTDELVGIEGTVMTINEETDRGVFARIVPESIKVSK